MSNIHPSAVVEDGAQIAASAKIGPLCYVSGKAKIGENVQLIAHVTILGDTTIGEGTIVFPGAVLGAGPQDHGNEFKEEAKLIIGKRNIIRENVTMHAGTPKEHFTTTVGDDGMFMINSHVAHDCVVGNNVIMTNNAVIGGHAAILCPSSGICSGTSTPIVSCGFAASYFCMASGRETGAEKSAGTMPEKSRKQSSAISRLSTSLNPRSASVRSPRQSR